MSEPNATQGKEAIKTGSSKIDYCFDDVFSKYSRKRDNKETRKVEDDTQDRYNLRERSKRNKRQITSA